MPDWDSRRFTVKALPVCHVHMRRMTFFQIVLIFTVLCHFLRTEMSIIISYINALHSYMLQAQESILT